MLSLRGVRKRFQGRVVLDGIDLDIAQGEAVGLIGRSGIGKSTLARCLVGLERADAGEIRLDGAPIRPGRAAARQAVQYLWQDPSQSLSPYLTAQGAVEEVLNGFHIGPAAGRAGRAAALLDRLGLPAQAQGRRPHALSGGQCQRTALARALAAEPRLLILDEPLSSLDLPSQHELVTVLKGVRARTRAGMLIISHDVAPLLMLANRILVMDQGRIVETLAAHSFCETARHPISRAHAEMLEEAMTAPRHRGVGQGCPAVKTGMA
ncbi:MAG: ABC transporter ATP-binding protein [Tropicimonas sp.]|uniref:ABC transporter ATP-binding protein n=1 Tax=Tropicimonas sp. TaxID=2067044 RepID=UPI003A87A242